MDEVFVNLVFAILTFIIVITLGILGTYCHFHLRRKIDNLQRVLVKQTQLPVRSHYHCDQGTSTSNLKVVTFVEDQSTPLYTSVQCTPLPYNPYYEIPKELATDALHTAITERNEDDELVFSQSVNPSIIGSVSSSNNVVLAGDDKEEEEKLLETDTKLAVEEEPDRGADRFLAVEATLATLIEQHSKLLSRFNKLSK